MRVRGASIRFRRESILQRDRTPADNNSTIAAVGTKSVSSARRPGVPNMGVAPGLDDDELAAGHVSQKEDPYGSEQQRAREHEEASVAEGKFEANAQTGGSIHRLYPWSLPSCRCVTGYRSGSQRRPRWR